MFIIMDAIMFFVYATNFMAAMCRYLENIVDTMGVGNHMIIGTVPSGT